MVHGEATCGANPAGVDIHPITNDKARKPGRSPAVSGGSSFFGPQQGALPAGAMGSAI
jgi:hypothetical protein